MAELELPTIQLQRYVDLLKRRRWQLIPFGLLGLLVGGIIAALIPRYYEAKTTVRLHRGVLGPDVRGEDEFLQGVENAGQVIKSVDFIRQAIEELAWPDYFPLGPGSYEELAAAAERVTVKDLNPAKARPYALLLIGYRDRNAVRSRDLTNKLLDLYLKREWDAVNARATASLKNANDNKNSAIREVTERTDQLRAFDTVNGLAWIKTSTGVVKDSMSLTVDALDGVRKEIRDREAKQKSVQAKRTEVQRVLAETLPMKPASLDPNNPITQQAFLFYQTVQYAKARLESVKPANQHYEGYKRELEQAEANLKKVLEYAKQFQSLEIENPAYTEVSKQKKALDTELAGYDAELKELRSQETTLQKRQDQIPDLMGERELIEASLDALKAKRTKLEEEHDRLSKEWSSLTVSQENVVQQLVPAWLPSEPTYPNIWVVASAGCLIGLFAAVGLVFLLDFLRSSYKTVDDAVRGLPVPVLGFVSHMETPEERLALRRRRLGWSAAAAAVILLSGSIIVVYNVDKTKLPGFVNKVLDTVLGKKP